MVVSILNQKGGVGKTSTTLGLVAGLILRGYRVLGVDLDNQGNYTYTVKAKTGGSSILEVLTGEAKPADAIQKTDYGDVIASSRALAGADTLITDTGKEYRLREALDAIRGQYDYILLDTPPSLGILTVNALTASQRALIPVQADIYSLMGVDQLSETIEAVRRYCNEDLTVDGILLTRYNARSILNRDLADTAQQLAHKLGGRLYEAKIREAVAVKEAQISQKSIYDYSPRSKVAGDYRDFVEEFIGRNRAEA